MGRREVNEQNTMASKRFPVPPFCKNPDNIVFQAIHISSFPCFPEVVKSREKLSREESLDERTQTRASFCRWEVSSSFFKFLLEYS